MRGDRVNQWGCTQGALCVLSVLQEMNGSQHHGSMGKGGWKLKLINLSADMEELIGFSRQSIPSSKVLHLKDPNICCSLSVFTLICGRGGSQQVLCWDSWRSRDRKRISPIVSNPKKAAWPNCVSNFWIYSKQVSYNIFPVYRNKKKKMKRHWMVSVLVPKLSVEGPQGVPQRGTVGTSSTR